MQKTKKEAKQLRNTHSFFSYPSIADPPPIGTLRRVILENLVPQFLLKVDKEKLETHQWNRIAQSISVANIARIEDEMNKMRE